MNEESYPHHRYKIEEDGICKAEQTGSSSNLDHSSRAESPSESIKSFSENGSQKTSPPEAEEVRPATDSTTESGTAVTYRSYPQRWIVLLTVCLLALSNATQWLSFAPLHYATTAFYCPIDVAKNGTHTVVQCDVEYWTSQIFQIVGVVCGLFGMFVTDQYGIRISCHCGVVLNFVGALIRVVSSAPQIPRARRLPTLYVGQTIAAMSQPFFLCLSPKVAEYWFEDHQRALANALSFIANPFGVVVGSIAPLVFVSRQFDSSLSFAENSNEILYLNLSLLLLATIVVLTSIGVTRSKPPTPPSASSDCHHKTPNFLQGISILIKSPIFYIQTLTFGMAFALQWSLFITTDKMFATLNYTEKVVGYLLSLSALSGTLASVFAGWMVDKTKKFKEFIKFSYIGIAFTATVLNIFLRHPKRSNADTVILVSLMVALGFFSVPIFPISLELGVETTFPVAEATSSGILIIAGQLLLFLVTCLMQFLESLNWVYGDMGKNYQLSIDFWTLTAILSAIFAYTCLWPIYHRMEYEKSVVFRNLFPPRFDELPISERNLANSKNNSNTH